jgi:16S rRNA (uracil1498-N3)-methyltransferase
MSERFFVETPIVGTHTTLLGQEAHHLLHVMRVRPGEQVILFDGSGAEFLAEITESGRNQATLRVLARMEVNRELPFELVLAVPLPKGQRQQWLVEKAVELGVARLIPLVTARTVVRPGPAAGVRLRRAVIEASKQCGRNRLLEIAEPETWQQLMADSTGIPRRLVAVPGGPHQRAENATGGDPASQASHAAAALAVGPEGGLTPEEVAAAIAAGWRPVDLGPRTLRVETAAVALAALVALPRAI